MATITTSTTGKKKIIYKQDPDGVFRLKKIPTDGRSNGKHDASKDEADDHLNELIGCTYQVLNSSTEDSKKSPTPESNAICPMDTRHATPEHQAGQRRNRTRAGHSSPANNTHSVRLKIPSLNLNTESIENMTGIHIPSFVAGCSVTVLCVSSSPLIGHYTSAIFNIVKLGLFWIILLGGITWYTGILKVQDSGPVGGFLNSLKESFFESDDIDQGSISNSSSDNISVQDDFNEYPRNNSIEFDIPSAVPRRRSASPVKSARTQITSVTPFKAPLKQKYDSRFQSNPELPLAEQPVPPKLSRFHSSDPKNFQNNHKRGSVFSLGKSRRSSNHSLELTKTKTNQSIPSVELIDSSSSRHSPNKHYSFQHDDPEELPFINEVKLLNNENDYRSELPDLPSLGPSSNVKRLNSTMSKQSVLGTRANYNKFLANVQGSDGD